MMNVELRQCEMTPEDVAPEFWPWPSREHALVDGVQLESAVPTRFFQTLDAYPNQWGRLLWRVQLNKIEEDRASAPVFRTFYPGVEWNLRQGGRWFLTAWLRWEGPGPAAAGARAPDSIAFENDMVLFCIGREPDGKLLYLRSRVDARDRRSIATAVQMERETPAADPAVISLDDILGRHD